MPHDFSIDKKTGIILVAGCSLVGVLLFIAGFLLGIQYRFPFKSANSISQSSSAKVTQARLEVPAPKPAQQPPEASAAPSNAAAWPVLTPALLKQQPPAGTSADVAAKTGSPGPLNQAGNAAQAEIQSPAAGLTAPAPPATDQTAPSPTKVATAKPPAPSSDAGKYSIQVGAFLNPKNAARLVKNLKAKGYQAKEFIATDSEYRVWHTVRIGPFKGMEAASQEARQFRQSAHLLALVRPADSL